MKNSAVLGVLLLGSVITTASVGVAAENSSEATPDVMTLFNRHCTAGTSPVLQKPETTLLDLKRIGNQLSICSDMKDNYFQYVEAVSSEVETIRNPKVLNTKMTELIAVQSNYASMEVAVNGLMADAMLVEANLNPEDKATYDEMNKTVEVLGQAALNYFIGSLLPDGFKEEPSTDKSGGLLGQLGIDLGGIFADIRTNLSEVGQRVSNDIKNTLTEPSDPTDVFNFSAEKNGEGLGIVNDPYNGGGCVYTTRINGDVTAYEVSNEKAADIFNAAKSRVIPDNGDKRSWSQFISEEIADLNLAADTSPCIIGIPVIR